MRCPAGLHEKTLEKNCTKAQEKPVYGGTLGILGDMRIILGWSKLAFAWIYC